MEKEKIQSNKGSSYKLLVEQAKLKQATSKVWCSEIVIDFLFYAWKELFLQSSVCPMLNEL